MKHGSLFSGIGGFDLAAEWVGWENVLQVENDKFCNKVLKKNFPKVKRYGDIKEFKGHKGQCDIISGGFPCQPFSIAGKQKGINDDNYYWPEMFRIIREIRPLWVVGENTPNITKMVLDEIYDDLENENYSVQAFDIPAGAVGSPQYRYRTWIVANSNKVRCREQEKKQIFSRRPTPEFCPWWSVEPRLDRVAYGLPNQMDRGKGLGNSIVPQVAYEIFKAIENENQNKKS